MSTDGPVQDGGAARGAPGGAMHIGAALRARHGGRGLRHATVVAGIPFAPLWVHAATRRASRPHETGTRAGWEPLGTTPMLRGFGAVAVVPPAEPLPWRGPLGVGEPEAAASSPRMLQVGEAAALRMSREPVPFRVLGTDAAVGHAYATTSSPPRAVDPAAAPAALPRAAHFSGLPERLVPAWATLHAPPQGDAAAAASVPHPQRVPARREPPPAATPAAAAGGHGAAGEYAPPREYAAPREHGTAGGHALPPTAAAAAGELAWRLPASPPAGAGVATPAASDESEGRGARATRIASAPLGPARASIAHDAAALTPLTWAVRGDAPGEASETRVASADDGAASALVAALPQLAWPEPRGMDVRQATRASAEAPAAATRLPGPAGAAAHAAASVPPAEATPAAASPPPTAAVDPTSDEVVRAVMRKIEAVVRDERFRAGRLR